MQMPIEHELGTLIRRMNPYTTGLRGSMLLESHVRAPFVAPANANDHINALNAAANAADAFARSARRAAEVFRAARDAGRPSEAQPSPEARAAAREAHADFTAAMDAAAEAADQVIDLAHIDVVIDDFIANYSSADWVFRGQPQTVKRALQITYRYQSMATQERPIRQNPGVYATEHILVGYAGGNGSA
jgi:hypothetical protein